ncbi:hypothetical protein ACFQZ4_49875 [Catellatospora coxensis]|uniref:Uncharacterized protein n=1 Tax=Catellatospora coxensis TaxID=310354 RepID=A0A8J3KWT4_9ACTN|nr:hypothetical protein [Catellatospora coxensis]GIG06719.1 hypothetical protein Cco03nite_34190 [Catellatospora coxensis]
MTVFFCGTCGVAVTGDVSEIPFPDEPAVHDDRTLAPSRMAPGSFARDPDRFGPPFEPAFDDPKLLVSAGPALTILVHPDDVRGLRLHPDPRRLNGCCRLDGCDGPNLVCAGCGAEIATEQSDCWVSWHDIRLDPTAVTEHHPDSDQW